MLVVRHNPCHWFAMIVAFEDAEWSIWPDASVIAMTAVRRCYSATPVQGSPTDQRGDPAPVEASQFRQFGDEHGGHDRARHAAQQFGLGLPGSMVLHPVAADRVDVVVAYWPARCASVRAWRRWRPTCATRSTCRWRCRRVRSRPPASKGGTFLELLRQGTDAPTPQPNPVPPPLRPSSEQNRGYLNRSRWFPEEFPGPTGRGLHPCSQYHCREWACNIPIGEFA